MSKKKTKSDKRRKANEPSERTSSADKSPESKSSGDKSSESKSSSGSSDSSASAPTGGPRFLCVHCDHRFVFEGEGGPSRCPACMRKGGIEKLDEGMAAARPGWVVPVAAMGVVLAVAAAYAFWSSRTPDVVEGEAEAVPLSISELRGYLAQAGADGDQADAISAGEHVEALAEHASGGTDRAKVESLMDYIGQRRAAGAYTFLPLDTPRDTPVHGAEWTAEKLEGEEGVALYPLEVALAAVSALREADVPAMVADIWKLDDGRRPPDPSGQMGFFGVALAAGDDVTYYDPYSAKAVDEDAARVLTDVQAVAAFMSLRGLHKLVHENDGVRALSDVARALTLDERSPYVRTARGTILTQSGGLEEGVQELEAAANLRTDAARRNNLGGLFIALQRFEDADQAITAALEESPDFAFAHANLAVIHLSNGDHSSARSELEQAERLQPSLHVLPLLWAQYHLAEHDTEQTERWIRTAVERAPRSVQAHLAAAQLYRAIGKSSDMRREVQATLDLVPDERRESFRQEIRARLGASALEEPDELEGLDELDLGDDLGLGLGGGGDLDLGGGGLLGGDTTGGPSLLDEDLGGGDFSLGGGGGGLRLQDPSAGGFQLQLGE